MINRAELEATLKPYLQPAGNGLYRPDGPRLRDLVELKATFDNAGVCQRLQLTLTGALPEHPALGPAVHQLLEALARAVLDEPLGLKPGQSRSSQGLSLSWSVDKGRHVITVARRKGLLGFFG